MKKYFIIITLISLIIQTVCTADSNITDATYIVPNNLAGLKDCQIKYIKGSGGYFSLNPVSSDSALTPSSKDAHTNNGEQWVGAGNLEVNINEDKYPIYKYQGHFYYLLDSFYHNANDTNTIDYSKITRVTTSNWSNSIITATASINNLYYIISNYLSSGSNKASNIDIIKSSNSSSYNQLKIEIAKSNWLKSYDLFQAYSSFSIEQSMYNNIITKLKTITLASGSGAWSDLTPWQSGISFICNINNSESSNCYFTINLIEPQISNGLMTTSTGALIYVNKIGEINQLQFGLNGTSVTLDKSQTPYVAKWKTALNIDEISSTGTGINSCVANITPVISSESLSKSYTIDFTSINGSDVNDSIYIKTSSIAKVPLVLYGTKDGDVYAYHEKEFSLFQLEGDIAVAQNKDVTFVSTKAPNGNNTISIKDGDTIIDTINTIYTGDDWVFILENNKTIETYVFNSLSRATLTEQFLKGKTITKWSYNPYSPGNTNLTYSPNNTVLLGDKHGDVYGIEGGNNLITFQTGNGNNISSLDWNLSGNPTVTYQNGKSHSFTKSSLSQVSNNNISSSSGFNPDIAIQPGTNNIVQVFNKYSSSTSGSLYSLIGEIDTSTTTDSPLINWTGKVNDTTVGTAYGYDIGLGWQPKVAITNSGIVAAIHLASNGSDEIWYHVGTLSDNNLTWKSSDGIHLMDGTDAQAADIASIPNNKGNDYFIIIFSDSKDSNNLKYCLGSYSTYYDDKIEFLGKSLNGNSLKDVLDQIDPNNDSGNNTSHDDPNVFDIYIESTTNGNTTSGKLIGKNMSITCLDNGKVLLSTTSGTNDSTFNLYELTFGQGSSQLKAIAKLLGSQKMISPKSIFTTVSGYPNYQSSDFVFIIPEESSANITSTESNNSSQGYTVPESLAGVTQPTLKYIKTSSHWYSLNPILKGATFTEATDDKTISSQAIFKGDLLTSEKLPVYSYNNRFYYINYLSNKPSNSSNVYTDYSNLTRLTATNWVDYLKQAGMYTVPSSLGDTQQSNPMYVNLPEVKNWYKVNPVEAGTILTVSQSSRTIDEMTQSIYTGDLVVPEGYPVHIYNGFFYCLQYVSKTKPSEAINIIEYSSLNVRLTIDNWAEALGSSSYNAIQFKDNGELNAASLYTTASNNFGIPQNVTANIVLPQGPISAACIDNYIITSYSVPSTEDRNINADSTKINYSVISSSSSYSTTNTTATDININNNGITMTIPNPFSSASGVSFTKNDVTGTYLITNGRDTYYYAKDNYGNSVYSNSNGIQMNQNGTVSTIFPDSSGADLKMLAKNPYNNIYYIAIYNSNISKTQIWKYVPSTGYINLLSDYLNPPSGSITGFFIDTNNQPYQLICYGLLDNAGNALSINLSNSLSNPYSSLNSIPSYMITDSAVYISNNQFAVYPKIDDTTDSMNLYINCNGYSTQIAEYTASDLTRINITVSDLTNIKQVGDFVGSQFNIKVNTSDGSDTNIDTIPGVYYGNNLFTINKTDSSNSLICISTYNPHGMSIQQTGNISSIELDNNTVMTFRDNTSKKYIVSEKIAGFSNLTPRQLNTSGCDYQLNPIKVGTQLKAYSGESKGDPDIRQWVYNGDLLTENGGYPAFEYDDHLYYITKIFSASLSSTIVYSELKRVTKSNWKQYTSLSTPMSKLTGFYEPLVISQRPKKLETGYTELPYNLGLKKIYSGPNGFLGFDFTANITLPAHAAVSSTGKITLSTNTQLPFKKIDNQIFGATDTKIFCFYEYNSKIKAVSANLSDINSSLSGINSSLCYYNEYIYMTFSNGYLCKFIVNYKNGTIDPVLIGNNILLKNASGKLIPLEIKNGELSANDKPFTEFYTEGIPKSIQGVTPVIAGIPGTNTAICIYKDTISSNLMYNTTNGDCSFLITSWLNSSKQYDSGCYPQISVSNLHDTSTNKASTIQYVVEVHNSENEDNITSSSEIYYHIAKIKNGNIVWINNGGTTTNQTGYKPVITFIGQTNYVISVHQASKTDFTLWYNIGKLDTENNVINWVKTNKDLAVDDYPSNMYDYMDKMLDNNSSSTKAYGFKNTTTYNYAVAGKDLSLISNKDGIILLRAAPSKDYDNTISYPIFYNIIKKQFTFNINRSNYKPYKLSINTFINNYYKINYLSRSYSYYITDLAGTQFLLSEQKNIDTCSISGTDNGTLFIMGMNSKDNTINIDKNNITPYINKLFKTENIASDTIIDYINEKESFLGSKLLKSITWNSPQNDLNGFVYLNNSKDDDTLNGLNQVFQVNKNIVSQLFLTGAPCYIAKYYKNNNFINYTFTVYTDYTDDQHKNYEWYNLDISNGLQYSKASTNLFPSSVILKGLINTLAKGVPILGKKITCIKNIDSSYYVGTQDGVIYKITNISPYGCSVNEIYENDNRNSIFSITNSQNGVSFKVGTETGFTSYQINSNGIPRQVKRLSPYQTPYLSTGYYLPLSLNGQFLQGDIEKNHYQIKNWLCNMYFNKTSSNTSFTPFYSNISITSINSSLNYIQYLLKNTYTNKNDLSRCPFYQGENYIVVTGNFYGNYRNGDENLTLFVLYSNNNSITQLVDGSLDSVQNYVDFDAINTTIGEDKLTVNVKTKNINNQNISTNTSSYSFNFDIEGTPNHFSNIGDTIILNATEYEISKIIPAPYWIGKNENYRRLYIYIAKPSNDNDSYSIPVITAGNNIYIQLQNSNNQKNIDNISFRVNSLWNISDKSISGGNIIYQGPDYFIFNSSDSLCIMYSNNGIPEIKKLVAHSKWEYYNNYNNYNIKVNSDGEITINTSAPTPEITIKDIFLPVTNSTIVDTDAPAATSTAVSKTPLATLPNIE